MQQKFLEVFESEIDGIFVYCCGEVLNREVALALTHKTFFTAWDTMPIHASHASIKKHFKGVASSLIKEYQKKQALVHKPVLKFS
jgi:hypothetical protein